MRSIAEIDRDFAGMSKNCVHPNSGCRYPSCDCTRAGAVPIPKQTAIQFTTCTLHPEHFVVINEQTGEKWRGQADGNFKRVKE